MSPNLFLKHDFEKRLQLAASSFFSVLFRKRRHPIRAAITLAGVWLHFVSDFGNSPVTIVKAILLFQSALCCFVNRLSYEVSYNPKHVHFLNFSLTFNMEKYYMKLIKYDVLTLNLLF